MLKNNIILPCTITENLLHTATDSVLNAHVTGRDFPDVPPASQLPVLLQKVVEVFGNDKERDLVLYSSLVTIGGTMTNIKGTYRQSTCYTNLFFMAIAPPASGKSAMSYPRQLAQPIHQYYMTESKMKQAEYKSLPKGSKGTPPPFKVVFIPGNTSSSKLIQHLSDNSSSNTPAILFENELDTISITTASDFGNYSDILRKTFHNESVSQSRRGNDGEYLDVTCPKLAVVLSGTPGQVFKFINNREDGLLSRFLVMNFNNNQGWQNVSPCPDCINLTDYFRALSLEYFKIWEFISKDELEITLSETQWNDLEDYCGRKYLEISLLHREDATSIIKRHGIMLFKLCMILTGLRESEYSLRVNKMVCRDEDFSTALYLIDKSLYSALEIYEALPDVKSPNLNNNKEGFYDLLTGEFIRAEAVAKGKELNISERSVDRYLREFVVKLRLSQVAKGRYLKVE